jgi:hypothetical protein
VDGIIPADVFVETRKLYTKYYAAANAPLEARWAAERRGHLK